MTDHTNTRTAIASLMLLFWNYTSEDIEQLRRYSDFDYLWNKYVTNEANHDSYVAFWEVYERSGRRTKDGIINRALLKYRDEARDRANYESPTERVYPLTGTDHSP